MVFPLIDPFPSPAMPFIDPQSRLLFRCAVFIFKVDKGQETIGGF